MLATYNLGNLVVIWPKLLLNKAKLNFHEICSVVSLKYKMGCKNGVRLEIKMWGISV